MRDDYGIRITTTGVVNEPDAEDWKIVPASDYRAARDRDAARARRARPGRRQGDRPGVRRAPTTTRELVRRDRGRSRGARLVRRARHPLLQHGGHAASSPTACCAHGKQYWMTEAGGGRLRRLGRARLHLRRVGLGALPQRPQQRRHPLGVVHRPRPRHARRLPEARDVRGPLRRPGADLQELRLPSRAAGHAEPSRPARPCAMSRAICRSGRTWSGPMAPSRRCMPRPGVRPDGRFALAVVNDTPGIAAARTQLGRSRRPTG